MVLPISGKNGKEFSTQKEAKKYAKGLRSAGIKVKIIEPIGGFLNWLVVEPILQ